MRDGIFLCAAFFGCMARTGTCGTAVEFPTREATRDRAVRVEAALTRGAKAVLEGRPRKLLELLSDEDVLVRMAVLAIAHLPIEMSTGLRLYADLSVNDHTGEWTTLVDERARVRLGREIEARLESLAGTSWPRDRFRDKLRDMDMQISGLVTRLYWSNNMYHSLVCRDALEQAEISLLMLELARFTRGADNYRTIADAAAACFARTEAYRNASFQIGHAALSGSSPEAIDRYLDWHWELLQYCYFHPLSRHFYVDGEALKAGVPSADYRKDHAWGEHEGPDAIPRGGVLGAPAAGVAMKARLRYAGERAWVGSGPESGAVDAQGHPRPEEAQQGETARLGATGQAEIRKGPGSSWLPVVGFAAGLAVGAGGAWLLLHRRSGAA